MCLDCGIVPRHGKKKSYCKDCRNKRERAAYDAKPFEIRAKQQLDKYYRSHESRKATNRVVRKAYYLRNRERENAYSRKWIKEHPAYKRDWDAANPEKARAIWARRRARMRGADGSFTHLDWREIVERQDSTCLSCKKVCKLTVDHIIPLSKGGSNWPSNLQGLCGSCNSSKNARLDYQFRVQHHNP